MTFQATCQAQDTAGNEASTVHWVPGMYNVAADKFHGHRCIGGGPENDTGHRHAFVLSHQESISMRHHLSTDWVIKILGQFRQRESWKYVFSFMLKSWNHSFHFSSRYWSRFHKSTFFHILFNNIWEYFFFLSLVFTFQIFYFHFNLIFIGQFGIDLVFYSPIWLLVFFIFFSPWYMF